jgi:hypothetical protein
MLTGEVGPFYIAGPFEAIRAGKSRRRLGVRWSSPEWVPPQRDWTCVVAPSGFLRWTYQAGGSSRDANLSSRRMPHCVGLPDSACSVTRN